MGPLLAATRGSQSPPAMLASSDPFVAFGLSGCEEQEEKMRMQKFFEQLRLILVTVQALTLDCVMVLQVIFFFFLLETQDYFRACPIFIWG